MQSEIEVKFLAVDHDVVRERLKKLGARLEQPMRLMRRSVMDFPDGRLEQNGDAHLRVRDEGHRVTITYKQYDQLSVDGAKEIEVETSDYETAVKVFKALGLHVKSEQESKRETWQLDDCEVVLDEWPWLRPYIEIEGPSPERLQEVARQLGFDWAEAVFGSVTVAYRHEYDLPRHLSIGENPQIMFRDPIPEWMQRIRRAA